MKNNIWCFRIHLVVCLLTLCFSISASATVATFAIHRHLTKDNLVGGYIGNDGGSAYPYSKNPRHR